MICDQQREPDDADDQKTLGRAYTQVSPELTTLSRYERQLERSVREPNRNWNGCSTPGSCSSPLFTLGTYRSSPHRDPKSARRRAGMGRRIPHGIRFLKPMPPH
jgi:hypothetical protein